MKKVRSLTNGNVLDMTPGDAQEMVDKGLFEYVDEKPSKGAGGKAAKPAAKTPAKKSGGKYKRRDLKAE